jgi:hypothetical protein
MHRVDVNKYGAFCMVCGTAFSMCRSVTQAAALQTRSCEPSDVPHQLLVSLVKHKSCLLAAARKDTDPPSADVQRVLRAIILLQEAATAALCQVLG